MVDHLIDKKRHARLASEVDHLIYKNQSLSVRDLMSISNDLVGNLKEFIMDGQLNNLSVSTLIYYSKNVCPWIDFLYDNGIKRADQLNINHVKAYIFHLKR